MGNLLQLNAHRGGNQENLKNKKGKNHNNQNVKETNNNSRNDNNKNYQQIDNNLSDNNQNNNNNNQNNPINFIAQTTQQDQPQTSNLLTNSLPKRKPLNLKEFKLKKLQQQIIDPHDLYLKTFDACNGRKYIFYDYQKHQQGIKMMKNYNKYTRGSQFMMGLGNELNDDKENIINNSLSCRKSSKSPNKSLFMPYNHQTNILQLNPPNQSIFQPHYKNQLHLSSFQQFYEFRLQQKQKQKCALLPINLVLNQNNLNNIKGIKKIVNSNKSNKIVFVNHQGKPITYYIKKNNDTEFGMNGTRNQIQREKEKMYTQR